MNFLEDFQAVTIAQARRRRGPFADASMVSTTAFSNGEG
jgi:hypothetical protein